MGFWRWTRWNVVKPDLLSGKRFSKAPLYSTSGLPTSKLNQIDGSVDNVHQSGTDYIKWSACKTCSSTVLTWIRSQWKLTVKKMHSSSWSGYNSGAVYITHRATQMYALFISHLLQTSSLTLSNFEAFFPLDNTNGLRIAFFIPFSSHCLTFLRTCCSLAEWILTCLRRELGSVYRLVQPGIWHAYGFYEQRESISHQF